MRFKTSITMLATLALLATVVPMNTHASPSDMLQKVQGAKTPSDHTALAEEYEAMAASATESAATHRKMGEAYKGMPAVSGGKAAGVSAMPQHCAAIAKSFDEQAKMYKEMAAAERALASAK